MACYMYDAAYCKVMTIAVCDIQSEDAKVQCIMWRELNDLMRKTTWRIPTSKASWRTVCRPIGMLSESSMALVIQRSP
jgi:hypothetical protein